MLKSELEKAAREYRLNEDGPEGAEFEAGAKWALEWVLQETRKLKTLDEFCISLEIQSDENK